VIRREREREKEERGISGNHFITINSENGITNERRLFYVRWWCWKMKKSTLGDERKVHSFIRVTN
jgi:hypothetical protein